MKSAHSSHKLIGKADTIILMPQNHEETEFLKILVSSDFKDPSSMDALLRLLSNQLVIILMFLRTFQQLSQESLFALDVDGTYAETASSIIGFLVNANLLKKVGQNGHVQDACSTVADTRREPTPMSKESVSGLQQ